MKAVKVGVIGCGKISGAYFGMAKNFPGMEMTAVADVNMDVAKAKAAEFNIPVVRTVDDLLKDESIEIVLNLTIPRAHAEIALRAIEAGKHTYAEKPLGISREEGRRVLDAAKAKGVLVGCAPDTFLGAGQQTARKLIDDGVIGRPVSFTAQMLSSGPESGRPNPAFYYDSRGGPMCDMGPYYLTALFNLLGPVARYSGMTGIAIPQRTIGSEPFKGQTIDVKVADHVAGMIQFQGGCVGTLVTSFATRYGNYDGGQPITIYGTEGAIKIPDPNFFDGKVHYRRTGDDDWTWQPLTFTRGYGRSVGLADMAHAVRTGTPFRASGDLAFAVLDLMQGFHESSGSGQAMTPAATFDRPAAMRADLPFGTMG